MQDLEKLKKQLQASGKADAIEKLVASAEGRAVSRMVDGKALERAVGEGDAAALKAMLGQALRSDEGRRLAENLRRLMEP